MKIVLFLNNDITCCYSLERLSEQLKDHELKIISSRQKLQNADLFEMQKFESCSIENSVSYDNINSDEAFWDLKNFSPDLMISIRYGQIFKRAELISLPRCGIINLHSGILPKYRGVMPSFWAILRGEKNLGMTLHYVVDSSIDSGPIIDSFSCEINWDLPLTTNIRNLYPRGCEMILNAVKKISAGEKIAAISQKELGESQYFSYPKSEDLKNFSKKMRLF